MIKRLITCLMFFAMISSSFKFAYAEESELRTYKYGDEEINVITQMGIIDSAKLSAENEKLVTRVDFAVMLHKLINLNNEMVPNASKSYFYDVDLYHYAAGEIQMLVDQGIIYGAGDGLFLPDEPIKADHAATMLLRVAGYGVIEKEHNSDIISAKADILDGIAGEITYMQAAQLLYNALFVDCIVVDNYSVGNLSYKKGDIFLHEVLQLGYYEGVVNAVGTTSLNTRENGEGSVVIDSNVYDNAVGCTPDLLGFKVRAFYDPNDDGECVVAYERLSNDVLIIDATMFVNYSNNTISYYNESGKTKKAKVAAEKDILCNWNVVDSINDYIPVYGKLELIDSGADGEYDVVMIHSFENGIVSSVSITDETVKFKNRKSIKLSDYENVEIVSADGSELTFNSIKEDYVASIYSYEKEYLKLVISTESIQGYIKSTGTSDEGWPLFTVGENAYVAYPDYYKGSYEIRAGQEVSLLMDACGKVAGIGIGKSDEWQIGYLMKIARNDEPFGGSVRFKILESSGDITIYNSVEKCVADGDKKKTADELFSHINSVYADFADTDSNGKELVTTRIIRYLVNAEGLISKIDTPTRFPLGETVSSESLTDNNRLLIRIKGNFYRPGARYIYQAVGSNELSGTVLQNSGNLAFIVPKATNTDPDEEKDYRVTTMESLKKDVAGYYDLTAYNYSVDDIGTDILVIRMDAGVTDNLNVMLVDHDGLTLDENGEVAVQVTGLVGSSEQAYIVDEKTSDVTGSELQRGDVVSFTLSNGKMVLKKLLYRDGGDCVLNTGSFYSADGTKTLFSEFRVFAGEVSKISGDYAYIDIGDDAGIPDEVIILPASVLIYETGGRRGSVYVGDRSAISTKQDGSADRVIVSMIKGSGANVRSIIVIR